MISAGFCHLLGDAIVALTQSFTYPLAPFLCACGFMSTLIADQIVEAASGHHPPEVPVLVSLSEKEGEEEETLHSVAFVGAVGATPFPKSRRADGNTSMGICLMLRHCRAYLEPSAAYRIVSDNLR